MKQEFSNKMSIIVILLLFSGLALAKPCEVVFSDPPAFFEAMTRGLHLKEGQDSLMALYLKAQTPYPKSAGNSTLSDVLAVLNRHPELSKIPFREQILEFSVKEVESPQSLKSFVTSFQKSAGKIRNSLFQIEENLGFWMNMLGFKETKDPSLSKSEQRILKQKSREDFLAYLDTIGLDTATRQFIKDKNQPYRERTKRLYHSLLAIAPPAQWLGTASQAETGSASTVSPQTLRLGTESRAEIGSASTASPQTLRSRAEGQVASILSPPTRRNIHQALVSLVHTVGFGNPAWVQGLKSRSSEISFNSLISILNERDIVAFDLGFAGHFDELKATLGSKIPDETKILKQIQEDLNNQEQNSVKGEETLRLRALSLQESPFRSCLAGDCASQSYFAKALDPNFIYWTLTDSRNRSSGHVTVVLGEALNQEGQRVQVAFVDKIQGVEMEKLEAMLEGIRLSLKEKAYILALPKKMEGMNGLTNEVLIRNYVGRKIVPALRRALTHFKPHKHEYSFQDRHSRAEESGLQLLEFEVDNGREFRIQAGELTTPRLTKDVSVRSLYERILSYKDSAKEEEQSQFLSHLVNLNSIEELNVSSRDVYNHLDFVMGNKDFSFYLRKKAFYILIEFNMEVGAYYAPLPNIASFYFLKRISTLFSPVEMQALLGEMSNWRNGHNIFRKKFIENLEHNETWNTIGLFQYPLSIVDNIQIFLSPDRSNYIETVFDSPFSVLLDKGQVLVRVLSSLNKERVIIEIVKELLSKDANPNAKDKDGRTALMWAGMRGHIEIVKELLSKGANPHAEDKDGLTALRWAKIGDHLEIVQLLSQIEREQVESLGQTLSSTRALPVEEVFPSRDQAMEQEFSNKISMSLAKLKLFIMNLFSRH